MIMIIILNKDYVLIVYCFFQVIVVPGKEKAERFGFSLSKLNEGGSFQCLKATSQGWVEMLANPLAYLHIYRMHFGGFTAVTMYPISLFSQWVIIKKMDKTSWTYSIWRVSVYRVWQKCDLQMRVYVSECGRVSCCNGQTRTQTPRRDPVNVQDRVQCVQEVLSIFVSWQTLLEWTRHLEQTVDRCTEIYVSILFTFLVCTYTLLRWDILLFIFLNLINKQNWLN